MKKIITGIILFSSIMTSAYADTFTFGNLNIRVDYNDKNIESTNISENNLEYLAQSNSGSYFRENIDYLRDVKWADKTKKWYFWDYFYKDKNTGLISKIVDSEKVQENFNYLIFQKITEIDHSLLDFDENSVKTILNNLKEKRYKIYKMGEYYVFSLENSYVVGVKNGKMYLIESSKDIMKEAGEYEYLNKDLIEIKTNKEKLTNIDLGLTDTNKLFMYKNEIPVFQNNKNGSFYINKKYESLYNCYSNYDNLISSNENTSEDKVDEMMTNFIKCQTIEIEAGFNSLFNK